jgi:hypothetical protein
VAAAPDCHRLADSLLRVVVGSIMAITTPLPVLFRAGQLVFMIEQERATSCRSTTRT